MRVSNEDPRRPLLTPREAARVLAISERKLWGLTKAGQVTCIRFGRAVRYDLSRLHAEIGRRKDGGR